MSSPGKLRFFTCSFSIFRFDPAPLLFSVSFSASTSLPGTLIRSGWWTCPRARTPRPCVWVRAGLRSPPVRWCSAFSPLEGSREKSSACQVLWCVWLDMGSSCSSFTTGVRHTLFTHAPSSSETYQTHSVWFQCVFQPSATGFDGEQSLGVQLLQFGRRKRQIINGEPLPLSLKSYLSWLGFTAEGEFLNTDLRCKNMSSCPLC